MKLKDEEEKKWAEIYSNSKKYGTGIGCPRCGEELIQTNPNLLLCSDPPRKSVHCNLCDFKGSILA